MHVSFAAKAGLGVGVASLAAMSYKPNYFGGVVLAFLSLPSSVFGALERLDVSEKETPAGDDTEVRIRKILTASVLGASVFAGVHRGSFSAGAAAAAVGYLGLHVLYRKDDYEELQA